MDSDEKRKVVKKAIGIIIGLLLFFLLKHFDPTSRTLYIIKEIIRWGGLIRAILALLSLISYIIVTQNAKRHDK